MEAWEKFEQLIDSLGPREVCNELEQWLSTDDLSEFVEHLEDAFDINDNDYIE